MAKKKDTAPGAASLAELEAQITEKQRNFARAIVEQGLPLAQAYRLAYDSGKMSKRSLDAASSAEYRKPKVANYMDKLRVHTLKQYQVDRNCLTEYLVDALRHARVTQNTKETRETVMAIAKLHGLLIDKQELTASHKVQKMNDVTLDGAKLVFDIGEPSENKSLENKDNLPIENNSLQSVDYTDLSTESTTPLDYSQGGGGTPQFADCDLINNGSSTHQLQSACSTEKNENTETPTPVPDDVRDLL